MTRSTLAQGLLIAVASAFGAYILIVELSRVLALTFCALLLMVAIDTAANFLNYKKIAPHGIAVGVVVLLVWGTWAGLGAWIGPQIGDQFSNMEEQVREGFGRLQSWLADRFGEDFKQKLPSPDEALPSTGSLIQNVTAAMSTGFGIIADVAIVFFVGLFLAINPGVYARGFLRLIPKERRARFADVLSQIRGVLQSWLVARLILMAFVGVAFGVGLFAIGVPLALALGVIAGILNFIPYLGPALAYIPAVSVALLEGPREALYVTVLYAVVQLTESYLVEPLVEARAVSLPPALLVLFQVFCALWLGFAGVLLATPLLVVVVVAVQMLYVEDVLGDSIEVTGSK